jgi:glycosyltransferase involved in cell wall biosynthesis
VSGGSTSRPDVVAGAHVLHLFANHKWTGPADPAIRTAAGLRERGWDVVFAEAAYVQKGGVHRMASELERARMPVRSGLQLRKHFHARAWIADARRLAAWCLERPFDILHTHLLADHLIAARAVRRLARRGSQRPVLVRSLYDAEAPTPKEWRTRFAFARTDGVVVPTESVAREVRERFPALQDRVLIQDPPTDRRETSLEDRELGRRLLGLDERRLVVGITARIQPHRRYELLWEVARRVADQMPEVCFVLLGRGDEADVERLVRAPIERLGLHDHVRLPGYLGEPHYARALQAFDVFLFLVPGSDGTCRAVREAMAIGLPIVATDAGMLPEIVSGHGVAVRAESEALAGALLGLLRDPEARRQAGAAALARARTAMDPVAAAIRLGSFYAALRSRARPRS